MYFSKTSTIKRRLKRFAVSLTAIGAWASGCTAFAADSQMDFIAAQIAAHPATSGVYVLDKGEEALLARAWLADHAQRSIDVQYFIWSTDNIGILAAEALLRAADRGVRVRIIVDDLLIDAPDKSLLALAKHPNIDIRIYNAKNSVGVPLQKKIANVASDFRGVNQRMHNKTFIVDGMVAITGGRNMAAEYYDYHQSYNFRDRDALLVGDVVKTMTQSFTSFWQSELSASVEDRFSGRGLMQKNVSVSEAETKNIYAQLHTYANSVDNFSPAIRTAIHASAAAFERLSKDVVWCHAEFLSDTPGKNANRFQLGGGGLTTEALAKLLAQAKQRVVIQSPYLIVAAPTRDLFVNIAKKGVRIRINTNSLQSTDNLQAFSGYRNQRDKLLNLGVEIYEYKPDAQLHRRVMQSELIGDVRSRDQASAPTFGLHAKTMVIDGDVTFIGTFNLDPRSENLNTEVGVVIHNDEIARLVEASIEADMQPVNSWNAAADNPDQYAPLWKRAKVRMWQWLPIEPLL